MRNSLKIDISCEFIPGKFCNTSKMIHKYCDTRVFLLCGNCPGGKSQIPFGLLWFSHKKICDVHLWRNLGFVRLWSTKFRNFWYFNQQPNHMGPWNIPKTNSRVCIWVQIFLYSHTRGCGLVHTILLSKVFVVLSQEFNLLSQVFSNVVWAVLHIFLKPEDAFVTSSISWQAVCFCVSKLCGIFQTTVCLEPYYTGTHPK